MTSSNVVHQIIKHSSQGLKSRTMRDYLRMRFAKAAPAANRLASGATNIAKGVGSAIRHDPLLGGAVAGLGIHTLAKRKTDTKQEAKVRSKQSARGGLGLVAGAHLGNVARHIHNNAPRHIKTGERVGQALKFRNGFGVAGAIAGGLGAHQVVKAFRKNASERGVKASFDAAMVLSHDAELRLGRQPSVGNRIDDAHTTISQRGGQAANAIGGGAATALGARLMHKAPITQAVRATLRSGGIRSSAMKLAMRSRGVAGVAAVGAGLHLLNKARKPIAASHEPLQLHYSEHLPAVAMAGTALGIAGLGVAAHLHAHLRHKRLLKEDAAKPHEWTHYSPANRKKVDLVNDKLMVGHVTGDYSHPLVVSMLKHHGEDLTRYGLTHDGKRHEHKLSLSTTGMPTGMKIRKPRSLLSSAATGALLGGTVGNIPGAIAGGTAAVGANLARRGLRKLRGIKASHDSLELGSRITPLPAKFGGIKKTMAYSTTQAAAKPAAVSAVRMKAATTNLKQVSKIHLLKSQLARRTVVAGVTGAVGGAGAVGAGLLAHHLIKKMRSSNA